MEVLVVGDVHGRRSWRRLVTEHPTADRVVFLGDYFDSFSVPAPEQLANWREILAYKREHPTRVTLLLGNHDYHYLDSCHARYSGYGFSLQRALIGALQPLVDDGTLCAGLAIDGRLYTHAGVSRTWAADWGLAEALPPGGLGLDAAAGVAAALDALLRHRPMAFDFQPAPDPARYNDPYGDRPWQGPLWIRPDALLADALVDGQIFGHTSLPEDGRIQPHPVGFSVDALHLGQYIRVVDGEVRGHALA